MKPVVLKSPTLLAENDPYSSAKSIAKIEVAEQEQTLDNAQKIDNREEPGARAEVRTQNTDKAKSGVEGKPILRAIPVKPEPEETPVEIRRAVPVGPMDEVEEELLLKAATPPPADSGHE